MKRTAIKEAGAARGVTLHGSTERSKYNETLLDELLARVEALETGRNIELAPEFSDGTREDGKADPERKQSDARQLKSMQMLGDAGRRPIRS